MNDKQPFKLEPEEPLQDEDDADCFEKNRNPEETGRRTGNTNRCLSM